MIENLHKDTQAAIKELHGDLSASTIGVTEWADKTFGGWGAYFVKIGAAIMAVVILVVLILCCCFPLIRGLVLKNINQVMNFQAAQMFIMAHDSSQPTVQPNDENDV